MNKPLRSERLWGGLMKVEIPVIISEDKLCECALDEEKKLELAQEIANKSLRDIQFELYIAAVDGGQT